VVRLVLRVALTAREKEGNKAAASLDLLWHKPVCEQLTVSTITACAKPASAGAELVVKPLRCCACSLFLREARPTRMLALGGMQWYPYFLFTNCLKRGGFSFLSNAHDSVGVGVQLHLQPAWAMSRVHRFFSEVVPTCCVTQLLTAPSHVCRLNRAGVRLFTANFLLQQLKSTGFV